MIIHAWIIFVVCAKVLSTSSQNILCSMKSLFTWCCYFDFIVTSKIIIICEERKSESVSRVSWHATRVSCENENDFIPVVFFCVMIHCPVKLVVQSYNYKLFFFCITFLKEFLLSFLKDLGKFLEGLKAV